MKSKFGLHHVLLSYWFDTDARDKRRRLHYIAPSLLIWTMFTFIGASLVEMESFVAKVAGMTILLILGLIGATLHGSFCSYVDEVHKNA